VENWQAQYAEAAAVVAMFQRHYLSLNIIFYFYGTGAIWMVAENRQDALCEALRTNDNLVVDLHLSKRVDRPNPRVEVLLTALPLTSVQLYEAEGEPSPLPVVSTSRRRGRRRKPRSLEELATRFNWE
jgi:hypothetical protein